MNVPTVSVVVPAYNAAAFIEDAIVSVLNQTVQPVEIIVVDDGSTDATSDVVAARFAASVRYMRQSNAGPAAARNRGVRSARGEWIAFLDADDTWKSSKLEQQLKLVHPEVALVQTLIEGSRRKRVPADIDFRTLWRANCIATSAVMVRKAVLEEVGGFPHELPPVEDWYVWMRIAAKGWRIATCLEPLTVYSPPPTSLSKQQDLFVNAHLRCIDRIGHELGLTQREIATKRSEINDSFVRGLVHSRRLSQARVVALTGFRTDPSLFRLCLLILTLLPRRIFDLYRSISTYIEYLHPSNDHALTQESQGDA